MRVTAPGGYCSGAVVERDAVLTCGHFFRDRETSEVRVLIDGTRHRISAITLYPGTDLALVKLKRPVDVAPLEIGPAPKVGARTVTLGFGGHATAPSARPGRFLGALPLAVSRGAQTIVRPAGFIHTSPPAVKGDSGGPVLADGKVVGVQSLILDPWGANLRIATVNLLRP